MPGRWTLIASVGTIGIVSTFAIKGVLMAPLPVLVVLALLASIVAFTVALDVAKVRVFGRL